MLLYVPQIRLSSHVWFQTSRMMTEKMPNLWLHTGTSPTNCWYNISCSLNNLKPLQRTREAPRGSQSSETNHFKMPSLAALKRKDTVRARVANFHLQHNCTSICIVIMVEVGAWLLSLTDIHFTHLSGFNQLADLCMWMIYTCIWYTVPSLTWMGMCAQTFDKHCIHDKYDNDNKWINIFSSFQQHYDGNVKGAECSRENKKQSTFSHEYLNLPAA